MSSRGRPVATSHAEIERVAFELFAARGFDAVTMGDIATEVGVGRRTLFRYFESKNDIPWGQFDRTLEEFRDILASMPVGLPLHEALQRGVQRFNEFPAGARPTHRDRMRLILGTPTLQAHSALRYAAWRAVIAEHVADRLGLAPGDLLPRTVGHVCLALAVSAYEAWLASPGAELADLLDEAYRGLREHVASG